jgi:hypothetical protein
MAMKYIAAMLTDLPYAIASAKSRSDGAADSASYQHALPLPGLLRLSGPGWQRRSPQVSSVFPTSSSNAVPLNANVVVHFNELIIPTGSNTIQLTPRRAVRLACTNSLSSG